MRFFSYLFLVMSLMFLTACASRPALAESSVLSFAPLTNYLIDYVVVAIVAVLGWAFTRLTKYLRLLFGLRIDESQRAVIMGAVERGVNFAADIVRERIKVSQGLKLDVRSELIKRGGEYVQQRVPDAVAYFKLKPVDIADMIAAKLEQQGLFEKFKNIDGR